MTPPEVVAAIASLTAWASRWGGEGGAAKWRNTVQDYLAAQAEEIHQLRNEITVLTLQARGLREDDKP